MRNSKNKLVIESNVEFRVEDEIQATLTEEVKKIVDNMSAKYMRNMKVTISVDVE